MTGDKACPCPPEAINKYMETCPAEWELYGGQLVQLQQAPEQEHQPSNTSENSILAQVTIEEPHNQISNYVAEQPHLSTIVPEPSQILTVYQEPNHSSPAHLNMDSGANVSFIRSDECHKRGFKILPNAHISPSEFVSINLRKCSISPILKTNPGVQPPILASFHFFIATLMPRSDS